MVHVPFDTRSIGYDDYIPQYGGGINGEATNQDEVPLHYFRGIPPFQRGYGGMIGAGYHQHGAGVGDILRGLLRMLMPLVRRGGIAVGKEALSTGERILNKVAQGENLKQSVLSEGKKGVDTLLEKSGLPKQFDTGHTKSIKRPCKALHQPFDHSTHQTIIGKVPSLKRTAAHSAPNNKRTKRRQRVDTFGFY